MPKKIDLTGQQFGRLVVIREADKRGRELFWECRCDCGKVVEINGNHLRRGVTTSCGCYRIEGLVNRSLKHGLQKTRQYRVWARMKQRCYDKNDAAYADYGGRGITVCPEWHDFPNFYAWAMANGYRDDLTLDRINVNGNYEPSNCRWATQIEQANNKRNNITVTRDGETHTMKEWSRILGISYSTIQCRVHRHGWTIEEAIFTPPCHKRR